LKLQKVKTKIKKERKMKKKALFLAAATAAVIGGGIFANPANAAEAGHMNKSNTDEVLLDALMNHATISMKDGELPLVESEGQSGPDLGGDFSTVRYIVFDCEGGDPLKDVQSWTSIGYFSNLESIWLCGVNSVDWTELAKINTLTNVGIYGPDRYAPGEEIRPIVESSPKVDISGIEKLANLEKLEIYGLPLYDLQTIPQIPSLKQLYVSYSAIQDISPISNMNKLQNLDLSGNNIVNMDPLLDFCTRVGVCSEKTWEELLNSYQRLAMLSNVASIDVDSLNVELPEYFAAYIKFALDANAGITGTANQRVYTIKQQGLELSEDNRSVVLDPAANEHAITILLGKPSEAEEDAQKIVTIRFNYSPSGSSTDNPETLDHSMLGWAMGLAAAIIAGTSVTFFVRSRR
jgi:hypothetical protein